MSPRWLQFSVRYCLRRRHGDPTTKICYIQGERFLEILSKQDGRRASYFVSCHSDETVYALLEPRRPSPRDDRIVVISTQGSSRSFDGLTEN